MSGGAGYLTSDYFAFAALLHEGSDIPLLAAEFWDRYRMHAIYEGVLPETGPPVAAVYHRIAGLVGSLGPSDLESETWAFHHGESFPMEVYTDGYPQPPEVIAAGGDLKNPDYYFLDPENVFRRLCVAGPTQRNFRAWYGWTMRFDPDDWRLAERALEAWAKALPEDSQPHLLLAQRAHERNALKKASTHLDEAAKLDGTNALLQRLRVLLFLSQGYKHLRDRKPHLVHKDCDAIEQVGSPIAQRAEPFALALRWCAYGQQQDRDERSRVWERLQDYGGIGMAGEVLLHHATTQGNISDDAFEQSGDPPAKKIAAAACHVCHAASEFSLPIPLPGSWIIRVCESLSSSFGKELPPEQVYSLGHQAMKTDHHSLAFACSGALLQHSGPYTARALFLRAHGLASRRWERDRVRGVLCVALQIARRERDQGLVDEIVNFDQELSDRYFYPFGAQRVAELSPLPESDVAKIIKTERKERAMEESAVEEARAAQPKSRPRKPKRRKKRQPAPRQPDFLEELGMDMDDMGSISGDPAVDALLREFAHESGIGPLEMRIFWEMMKNIHGKEPGVDDIPAILEKIDVLLSGYEDSELSEEDEL